MKTEPGEPKAALEPASGVEAALLEQMPILGEMLKRLKDIRRRLPPPSGQNSRGNAKPPRGRGHPKR